MLFEFNYLESNVRVANDFEMNRPQHEVLTGLLCNNTNKILGYNSISKKENIFLR